MAMGREELGPLAGLIRGQRWAALATHGGGKPLALSLHTRHLLADPAASLAISEADTGAGNPQTLARISLQGRVEEIPTDAPAYLAARALYERRLPSSAPLFGFGDFHLFRLVLEEARFVAGFAQAYTVTPPELAQASVL